MERKVKMKLRIDFKAMKYYNMYNLLYRKYFGWVYIVLALVCLAGAFISVAGSFIPGIKEPNYLLGVIFVLFFVYLIYYVLNLEKVIDRNIANYFMTRQPIEQDMTITDETITISSPIDPTKSVSYDWVNISKIHEIPQYYYLYLGKQPIIVDKDPEMILEGNYDDLMEIIKEKISVKPYRLIDKQIVKKPITFVHEPMNPDQQMFDEAEVVKDESNNEQVEEIKVEVKDASVEEAGNPEKKDD